MLSIYTEIPELSCFHRRLENSSGFTIQWAQYVHNRAGVILETEAAFLFAYSLLSQLQINKASFVLPGLMRVDLHPYKTCYVKKVRINANHRKIKENVIQGKCIVAICWTDEDKPFQINYF